ncbi:hypothetical protein Gohar_000013, partial [Gossypium harknessii]|nr:hypothetical protein [Gossypium harknessii]
MEKGFVDKVKDNAAVWIWSEKTQQEKGDNLTEGYMSELWDFTRISVTQNNLQKLKEVDLVPTVEEYIILLRCLRIQADKAYFRAANVLTFLKKLMSIIGMNTKKRVDVFALSIYGLIVFTKVLGHVVNAVLDLFDRLDKRVTPVSTSLAETFRYLSACRRAVSYQVFSKNYSPLKEFVATPRRDNISEEKCMAILQSLQDEDVEWRAPWMILDEILFRCGNFDRVPLLGIWRAIGYVLLLVLRQYRL